MTPAALDYRNREARRKISAAAALLAAALDLPALEQPTAIEARQPAVAQMRELEHIAALLEGVAASLEVSNG